MTAHYIARYACDLRIQFDNWYRSWGWSYGGRFKAFKESTFNRGQYNHNQLSKREYSL